ncbi:hypothetical protein TpMuguga_03g00525 [Theileria parva strain Muguga]|uniref:uncharacterized protein n=1 Tax=Theileria parva strain Muguga TaxID=333668 RepID=UPI001C61DADC|nr:uncharacterized protein TpMuguga_03g00525 [Theileria parva strain Muguga]EAN31270.2 hypothetical protein TpMuguga_03g00525 [Theileria parva strain Muguga]
MCIFITKYKYFTFNFGDQIIKSLDGSGIPYFKLVVKNNKTVKRLKTLKTIKFIHSIFSYPENKRKYLPSGNSVIYLDSIPKPRLIKSIKIYKNNVLDSGNTEDNGTGSELVKSLFGLKYSGKRRAKIMNKIKEMFPIELRSILFKFAMKYMDTFDESDLCHFEQLLALYSEDSRDSILLDSITCKNNSPNLSSGNPILLKLLKFVSSSHPSINNCNFKDSPNINKV